MVGELAGLEAAGRGVGGGGGRGAGRGGGGLLVLVEGEGGGGTVVGGTGGGGRDGGDGRGGGGRRGRGGGGGGGGFVQVVPPFVLVAPQVLLWGFPQRELGGREVEVDPGPGVAAVAALVALLFCQGLALARGGSRSVWAWSPVVVVVAAQPLDGGEGGAGKVVALTRRECKRPENVVVALTVKECK